MIDEMAEPVQQSYLLWVFHALGFKYAALLPLAALVSFALTLLVVIRGKGPFAAAAILLLVPLPFLVGLVGALDGTIASFAVIARSATTPKPSELAQGISMALVAPWLGLMLMAPTFLLAMIGSVVKSLAGESGGGGQGPPK